MTNNDENLSVPMQSAMVPLDMNADTAYYVGVLEGTIAALCINECKYRALLELLTGESWEGTRIDVNGEMLMELAISSLVKQTGMSIADAKILVHKRWNTYNQEIPAVIPLAVSAEQMVAGVIVGTSADVAAAVGTEVGTGVPAADAVATGTVTQRKLDANQRLQDWKARQIADAATLLEN